MADAIKRIEELSASGKSRQEIEEILKEEGLTPPSPKLLNELVQGSTTDSIKLDSSSWSKEKPTPPVLGPTGKVVTDSVAAPASPAMPLSLSPPAQPDDSYAAQAERFKLGRQDLRKPLSPLQQLKESYKLARMTVPSDEQLQQELSSKGTGLAATAETPPATGIPTTPKTETETKPPKVETDKTPVGAGAGTGTVDNSPYAGIENKLQSNLTKLDSELQTAIDNANGKQKIELGKLEKLAQDYRDEYDKGMDRQSMGELAETIGNAIALIGAGHATAQSAKTGTPFDATKGLQLSKKDWDKGMARVMDKLKVDLSTIKEKREEVEKGRGLDERRAMLKYDLGSKRETGLAEAKVRDIQRRDALASKGDNWQQKADYALENKKKLLEFSSGIKDEKQRKQVESDINVLAGTDEKAWNKLERGDTKGVNPKLVAAHARVVGALGSDAVNSAMKTAVGESGFFGIGSKAGDRVAASTQMREALPGVGQAAQAQAPAAVPQGQITVQIPGHEPANIPADKLNAFLQKYPNAKVVSK